jgi:hypothetical protein
MNVNEQNENVFLKLTFVGYLMPHGVPSDPSHGDVFPCPAPNCEQTKHNIQKFSVFRIT